MSQKMKIGVLALGLGNPQSVSRMLNRCGFKNEMVTALADVRNADVLILPGVGRFSAGMDAIRRIPGLHDYLMLFPNDKTLIGICLGMQLLFDASQEDNCRGLGLIPGVVKKLEVSEGNRVPNMGWRVISGVANKESLYIEDSWKFYFTHSFAVSADSEHCIAKTSHTGQVAAAVKCDNVIGFQFHPEKSHQFGMNLLKRTLEDLGV